MNTALVQTNTPIITIKNNALVTSSYDLAKYFEKSHKHVLRDIDELIEMEPLCAPNFGLSSKTIEMPNGGTRSYRAFDMTRDGFTLLAMGFTGKKALGFKLAYIQQFNAMEAQLNTGIWLLITWNKRMN